MEKFSFLRFEYLTARADNMNEVRCFFTFFNFLKQFSVMSWIIYDRFKELFFALIYNIYI